LFDGFALPGFLFLLCKPDIAFGFEGLDCREVPEFFAWEDDVMSFSVVVGGLEGWGSKPNFDPAWTSEQSDGAIGGDACALRGVDQHLILWKGELPLRFGELFAAFEEQVDCERGDGQE
jgi:hypothetical protein